MDILRGYSTDHPLYTTMHVPSVYRMKKWPGCRGTWGGNEPTVAEPAREGPMNCGGLRTGYEDSCEF